MLAASVLAFALQASPLCAAEAMPALVASAVIRYEAGDFEGAARLTDAWLTSTDGAVEGASPIGACVLALESGVADVRRDARREASADRAAANTAAIARAERLILARRFDDAEDLVLRLRQDRVSGAEIDALKTRIDQGRKDWADDVAHQMAKFFGSARPVAIGFLLVVLILVLAHWIRSAFALCERLAAKKDSIRHWRMLDIKEDGPLELWVDLVEQLRAVPAAGRNKPKVQKAHKASKSAPATPTDKALTGLLRIGALRIDAGLAGVSKPESVSIDLQSALDSTPNVGGFSAGDLFRFGNGLARWWWRGFPHISVRISTQGGATSIVLAARAAKLRPCVVRKISDGTKREHVVALVAEAAFEMLLELSTPQLTAATNTGAISLGARELEEYLANGGVTHLQRAAKAFERASKQGGEADRLTAMLYRGAVLDLLEDHCEAIRLFREVADSSNAELSFKARYNEAIAQMRRYTPAAFQDAKKRLTDLLNALAPNHELVGIARAARANVVAHELIFWKASDAKPPEDPVRLAAWLQPYRVKVDAWLAEANGDIETAANAPLLKKGSSAARQLQWAIDNAKGNLALNEANHIMRVEMRGADRRTRLEEARDAFKRCAALLPPGVETLTNLATTHLELGELEESAHFSERAIAINKLYEYGYYRLAQARQRSGDEKAAKSVLRRAKRELEGRVNIPSFQALFRDLGVAI